MNSTISDAFWASVVLVQMWSAVTYLRPGTYPRVMCGVFAVFAVILLLAGSPR